MENTAISLYQLNNLIKGVLKETLSEMFWIHAEMSDVRANQNGHCYLELIEKDGQGKSIVAKARAMIWANTFHLLRAYFESTTNQPFASGLKVLVQVSIEFHELYGLSLTIHDIDPRYTLGDQAMNRAAILKQLEEEGVLDLNKELELPILINRIAVISSPTAAGYEDFCNQLERNPDGFVFYKKLFPAIMQGDRAEDSVIAALEQIYNHIDSFDAVVIIRGGGATSELSCFDSYLLAASCAQFPLPIITGIGHERDETVLDIVAHTRAKTPTAVAEFLIDRMSDTAEDLFALQNGIISSVATILQENLINISTIEMQISYILKGWSKEQSGILELLSYNLKRNTLRILKEGDEKLQVAEKHLALISPENVLKRGYTLTMSKGKLVKQSAQLANGEEIINIFADGEVKSIVKKK